MTQKKKVTTMKDILEKNQRERDQKAHRLPIQNINVSPELIQQIAKALDEEQTRKALEDNQQKNMSKKMRR